MEDSGYFVWNPNASRPVVRHDAMHKAVTEAERLARNNPGQKFIVLRALGSAIVAKPGEFKPSYTTMDDDGIPF